MASPARSEAAEWLEHVEGVLGRKLTSIEVVGGIYCSICDSTFGNKKDYDSHYLDHSIGDADIGYTCVVCRKEFTGYPSFRNHCYLAHVTKNKHRCTHCSKSFSKQSILNSHIDATHTFKCASCKKQFSSKKELHTHQIIHKNDKDKPPYQCHQCGEAIESIDMCEYHIDEHCTSLYSCPICLETGNNKFDVAKHLTHHFGEELTDEDISAPKIGEECSIDILGGVLCNYCDELFKNRPEFDTHFVTEHSDKELIYSCNICGKQYDKYHLFGNHCYYHIAKDRFECTDCEKTFPRLSLLVLHTEAFHSTGSAEKPFSCGECGYRFKTMRRLCEHTRVVHESNAMRCLQEGCDRTFESLKDLIHHQRDHRTKRENWCRQCGLHFTTLSSCERHLDVHRKKHYACPVCNRVYHEKYLILKHIPMHFESVLHICKVCGKVFNQRSRLVQHSKTHSDLRTHICTICDKGFMKASHLEQHLNIHTGSKPYKCTVCPKAFASHPNWYKHMRRTHNIDKQKIRNAKDNINTKTIASTEAPPVTNNDNSDKSKIESGIDSTSSEMSLDTYCFVESDDSTMDSLDPTIIEKDWRILTETSEKDWSFLNDTSGKDWSISNEHTDRDWCITNENLIDNSLQYTDMLPVHNTTINSAEAWQAGSVPAGGSAAELREYGPEFNVREAGGHGGACIDLDEHDLPHIDPRLTIKRPPPGPPHCPPHCPPPARAWEPLITKVCHAYDDADLNRLSILNADIFI